MKKTHLYLLPCLALVLLATGCPTKPKVNFEDSTFVSRLNDHLKEQQIRYDCSARRHTYTVDANGHAACNETSSFDDGPREARRIRNDIIEEALGYIDDNYNDFINSIEKRRSRTDFILDVVELGTGAAIGITNGERAIQVLGVSLTAFRGGRRSSDLNFYRQQTTPILISKMDDNRSQVLAGILSKMPREIDQYSMRAAIRDIVAYYNAGTLVRAFTELAKDTADQANDSERVVRVLRGDDITISDIPTLEAANRSQSIFDQRRSLAQQVRDLRTRATAAGDEAARAITIPAAADPDNPTPEEQKAIAEAEARREAARKEKMAETLKPVRGKLETIWNEIEAADAFKPALERMKTDDRAGAILAKTAENRTEAEYLTLIDRLTAIIKDDAALSGQLLAILQRGNR